MALDESIRARLLARIGLDAPPPATPEGLRDVHRAFVSNVPFENLAVQLGESGPLDPRGLVERVLGGGRGGYCFEVNTVLLELLRSLGFEVERREAIVGPRDLYRTGEQTDHLALVATTAGGGQWIAEGGFGEGPVEPLALREGPLRSGEFELVLEREGDGWWLQQHEFSSTPGFRFADEAVELAAFAPHHERLSTSPGSHFVRTLIVQRPADDRITAIRARTLAVDGPGRRERRLLERDEWTATLEHTFGIDPDALGPDRLERLWVRACEQHVAHVEKV